MGTIVYKLIQFSLIVCPFFHTVGVVVEKVEDWYHIQARFGPLHFHECITLDRWEEKAALSS